MLEAAELGLKRLASLHPETISFPEAMGEASSGAGFERRTSLHKHSRK
jgi:hypothetical protein